MCASGVALRSREHDNDPRQCEISGLQKEPLRMRAIVWAAVLATAAAADLIGLEHIAQGYNVIIANPSTDASDPGWTSSDVFQLSYSQGHTFDDAPVPDNVTVVAKEQCSYVPTTSFLAFSSAAYQAALLQVSNSVSMHHVAQRLTARAAQHGVMLRCSS